MAILQSQLKFYTRLCYNWNLPASNFFKIFCRATLYLAVIISATLIIERSFYSFHSILQWTPVSNYTFASHFSNDSSTLILESTEQIYPKFGRFLTSHAEKVATSFKNPWPLQVKWIMQPPDPCASHSPFIISIVFTEVQNRERRNKVRRTWGHKDLYNLTQTRIVFLLGQTLDEDLQQQISEEHEQYSDILQYSAIDSYRNLTYKSLAGLRYVNDYCPEAPWVVKIDDDIQVNPFNMQTYLQNWINGEAKQKSLQGGIPRLIHGRLLTTGRPWRTGKYALTKEEYPSERYPTMALGPAYILRNKAVVPLLTHSLNITAIWLEDVYITGMVAKAAGIGHINNERFWGNTPMHLAISACYFKHAWKDETTKREEAWKKILKKHNIKHLNKFR